MPKHSFSLVQPPLVTAEGTLLFIECSQDEGILAAFSEQEKSGGCEEVLGRFQVSKGSGGVAFFRDRARIQDRGSAAGVAMLDDSPGEAGKRSGITKAAR